jgi:hypothetical protein
MSSRLMYGYRRHPHHGHIEHRVFDPDDFPVGWYDSPSKVPGADAPTLFVDTTTTIGTKEKGQTPAPYGEAYGSKKRASKRKR